MRRRKQALIVSLTGMIVDCRRIAFEFRCTASPGSFPNRIVALRAGTYRPTCMGSKEPFVDNPIDRRAISTWHSHRPAAGRPTSLAAKGPHSRRWPRSLPRRRPLKGAAYHLFTTKEPIFEAVLGEASVELAKVVTSNRALYLSCLPSPPPSARSSSPSPDRGAEPEVPP
jgi:hypothetical protein